MLHCIEIQVKYRVRSIALALLVMPHDRDDEPTMHGCCSGEVLTVHYSPASNNFCHNRGSVADRGDFEKLPTGRVNDIVAAAAFEGE